MNLYLIPLIFCFQELEKKEAEYKKSETIGRTDFNNLCKQLGITGVKIKKELTERIVELPEIYNRIAKKVQALKEVVDFYTAFVKFTLGNQHNGGCVPMVKYVIGEKIKIEPVNKLLYFIS